MSELRSTRFNLLRGVRDVMDGGVNLLRGSYNGLRDAGLIGLPFEQTPIGRATAMSGRPVAEQLAAPVGLDHPAMGFAGTTKSVGQAFDFTPGKAQRATVGPTNIDYITSPSGIVEVSVVKTPKEFRGQGSARTAMQEFLRQADENGVAVALTAEPMEAGVSKAGLERFYKSLGFQSNRGPSRDFGTRATMLRPQK